ncbi:hypothetical protein SAMN05660642_01686 [Geodermatophilus siccatus]|uniref:RAMA domain-containing protein n=1 Tax=Geodermatophilus siccatus TaxID=1137991 RepID=A0A1G9QI78_9ACTN|nr:hypothetical protein [Geodermatophilus siccatus]SDM10742.1 hypothetical protein SAMN05660642_01686 [Geodermatophilus siccatus]
MTAAAPGPGAADQLPLSVLLPDGPAAPALIYDTTAALAMAVVDRGAVAGVTGDWDVPGVYVLLDRHDADGTWGCYVGKAPGGVRTRLGQHLKGKDHWSRALLIRRDATFGFNSAHVGWLEGRLYDLLDAAADTRLHNANRPSDETLPPYERAALESIVPPIRRVLRLLGYDTETPDDQLTIRPVIKARSNRFYGITAKQLLDAGLLTPGETLTSTNGVFPATAVLCADGAVEYDGTPYPSPSKAASEAKGGLAANGWDFWAVERSTGRVPLATLRARWLDSAQSDNGPASSRSASAASIDLNTGSTRLQ